MFHTRQVLVSDMYLKLILDLMNIDTKGLVSDTPKINVHQGFDPTFDDE
jgi:hypothetical protein